jgi:hypothetical protein
MKRIQLADWKRIGTKLFGVDHKEWKFRCAHCGHSQSETSIRALAPDVKAVEPYFNCTGRYNKKVGCDWTLGGFFMIHTLEIFLPDSLTFGPVFEFDHPDAASEVDAVLMPPRTHTTTEVKQWSAWTWPEWVPAKLRSEVESFWSEKHGRSPKEWLDDAARREAPNLGDAATLRRICSEERVTGRFVHKWNNIGAIVKDDGTAELVSW